MQRVIGTGGIFFKLVTSLLIAVFFSWADSARAGDGFEGIKCGSDIEKQLIGRKATNEPVAKIEARHTDLGLKDLGASEISDRVSLVSWLICGDEYVVFEDGNIVRDVLKFPKHSKESPQFVGVCQKDGHDLPGTTIGILKNEEGSATLSVVAAWKVDEKQKKFVKLDVAGLRSSRDGIITADGGR